MKLTPVALGLVSFLAFFPSLEASAQQVRYFVEPGTDLVLKHNSTGVLSKSSPKREGRRTSPMREPDDRFLRQDVRFVTSEKPGTIIIDTDRKYLYLVEGNGMATRYGVGVGKDGFSWGGTHKITRKAEWPGWTPPAEMIARERAKGRKLPSYMPGGEGNPLGARALYLGSTLYRIHGTNQPWTIGQDMSSGCFRMMNDDVMELYDRVGTGTKVVVIGPGGKNRAATYQEG